MSPFARYSRVWRWLEGVELSESRICPRRPVVGVRWYVPAVAQIREREVRERRRSMKRRLGVMRRRVDVVSLPRSGICDNS